MKNNKLKKLESRIIQIKTELSKIGEMRSGSLTKQFYRRKDYVRPYWQISYTQDKKSKTEYVKNEFLKSLRKEIKEYKKFKKLTSEWLKLATEYSKEKIKSQTSRKS